MIGLPGCFTSTSGELVSRLGRTCHCMEGFATGCRFDVVLCMLVGLVAGVGILGSHTGSSFQNLKKFSRRANAKGGSGGDMRIARTTLVRTNTMCIYL